MKIALILLSNDLRCPETLLFTEETPWITKSPNLPSQQTITKAQCEMTPRAITSHGLPNELAVFDQKLTSRIQVADTNALLNDGIFDGAIEAVLF